MLFESPFLKERERKIEFKARRIERHESEEAKYWISIAIRFVNIAKHDSLILTLGQKAFLKKETLLCKAFSTIKMFSK